MSPVTVISAQRHSYELFNSSVLSLGYTTILTMRWHSFIPSFLPGQVQQLWRCL